MSISERDGIEHHRCDSPTSGSSASRLLRSGHPHRKRAPRPPTAYGQSQRDRPARGQPALTERRQLQAAGRLTTPTAALLPAARCSHNAARHPRSWMPEPREMQSLLSVLQRGCATLIVVQRSNARSACSLGFMRILSKCVTLARLQMEAATPAAASPSRTTRTTRLAACGGRPRRPDDPQAGQRDAHVTSRATASVRRRTAASRGENERPRHRDSAVPWHDRFRHSGVVVPAIPLPRMRSH